jgi:Fe-S cluster assembly ATP-binding protein
MRQVMNAHRRGGHDGTDDPISVKDFAALLRSNMELLEVDRSLAGRYLNDGFSGGEKKRLEILQMAMLEPELAILDETDSGLDIDALRIVSQGVNTLSGPDLGVLVITHYQRILNYIRPDHVHILMDGRIVRSGGAELALELEQSGYAGVAPQQEV